MICLKRLSDMGLRLRFKSNATDSRDFMLTVPAQQSSPKNKAMIWFLPDQHLWTFVKYWLLIYEFSGCVQGGLIHNCCPFVDVPVLYRVGPLFLRAPIYESYFPVKDRISAPSKCNLSIYYWCRWYVKKKELIVLIQWTHFNRGKILKTI